MAFCESRKCASKREQQAKVANDSPGEEPNSTMALESRLPRVSVIIPCYNGEKLIDEAIESVLNQTYRNFEIIIVDDGSTDNSKAVIERYLSNRQIHYIRHETNKGIPAARNTGIEFSTGPYIAFLDQDDRWLPHKLEIQLQVFRNGNTDLGLVFSNCLIVNFLAGTEKKFHHKPIKINQDKKRNVRDLFFINYIPSITVMIKRECVDEVGMFDECITWGADDYDLWMRIAGRFSIAYVNDVLAVRFNHGRNYSDPERMLTGRFRLVEKHVSEYPFLQRQRRRKLAELNYMLGRYHHKNKDIAKARKYYFNSVLSDALLGWKPYVAYLSTFLEQLPVESSGQ